VECLCCNIDKVRDDFPHISCLPFAPFCLDCIQVKADLNYKIRSDSPVVTNLKEQILKLKTNFKPIGGSACFTDYFVTNCQRQNATGEAINEIEKLITELVSNGVIT